jgi:hypothetical protein
MREDGGGLGGFAAGELPVDVEEGKDEDEGEVDGADAGWELTSAEGLDGFV